MRRLARQLLRMVAMDLALVLVLVRVNRGSYAICRLSEILLLLLIVAGVVFQDGEHRRVVIFLMVLFVGQSSTFLLLILMRLFRVVGVLIVVI